MADLIDRQAAINAMKELCENYTRTTSTKHPHINFIIEELEALPSVQPEITEKQVKEYCESRNLVVLTSEAYHWLKSLKSKAEEFRWNGGGNY